MEEVTAPFSKEGLGDAFFSSKIFAHQRLRDYLLGHAIPPNRGYPVIFFTSLSTTNSISFFLSLSSAIEQIEQCDD